MVCISLDQAYDFRNLKISKFGKHLNKAKLKNLEIQYMRRNKNKLKNCELRYATQKFLNFPKSLNLQKFQNSVWTSVCVLLRPSSKILNFISTIIRPISRFSNFDSQHNKTNFQDLAFVKNMNFINKNFI